MSPGAPRASKIYHHHHQYPGASPCKQLCTRSCSNKHTHVLTIFLRCCFKSWPSSRRCWTRAPVRVPKILVVQTRHVPCPTKACACALHGQKWTPGTLPIGGMHAFGVRPAPLLPDRCSERPLPSALAESVSCKRPSSGYQPSPNFRFPAVHTTPISLCHRHRRLNDAALLARETGGRVVTARAQEGERQMQYCARCAPAGANPTQQRWMSLAGSTTGWCPRQASRHSSEAKSTFGPMSPSGLNCIRAALLQQVRLSQGVHIAENLRVLRLRGSETGGGAGQATQSQQFRMRQTAAQWKHRVCVVFKGGGGGQREREKEMETWVASLQTYWQACYHRWKWRPGAG
jgi:hypothetical protein